MKRTFMRARESRENHVNQKEREAAIAVVLQRPDLCLQQGGRVCFSHRLISINRRKIKQKNPNVARLFVQCSNYRQQSRFLLNTQKWLYITCLTHRADTNTQVCPQNRQVFKSAVGKRREFILETSTSWRHEDRLQVMGRPEGGKIPCWWQKELQGKAPPHTHLQFSCDTNRYLTFTA